MRICIIIITVFFVVSCDSIADGAVAQYGDFVLTKTEVRNTLPEDMEQEDSLAYVNQVVEQWAKDKVFLHNSKEILSEEELQQIELKVKRYKDDITTSFIEDKLTQSINDSISKEEIDTYYNKFTDSFILKEDYLNYRYMILPKDSVSTYKALLFNKKLSELKHRLDLSEYVYNLTDNNWIPKIKFNESAIFPKELKSINLRTKNQIFTVSQGNSVFVFELIDYRKSGDTSPLPIVKDMIKRVLINKRKLNLLSEKKKELYNKALENDEIKKN